MSHSTSLLGDLPRNVLAMYPAAGGEGKITPVPVAGFSGARVWRVTTDSGSYALRAMPAESVDWDRLTGLHALLARIQQTGLSPVAVPLPNRTGRTFFRDEYGGWIWQVEPWLPGLADFHMRPSLVRLESAMRSLAGWHQAAATFHAPPASRTWFFCDTAGSPGLRERAQRVQFVRETLLPRLEACWPSPALPADLHSLGEQVVRIFKGQADDLARDLELGSRFAVPVQPVLRDIWHDHVLFTETAVTGLIDPGASRSDTVAADLARLLGSLVGADRTGWEQGLAAYRRVRELSFEELSLIPLFERSEVLLSPLNWLEWLVFSERQFADFTRAVDRLRQCGRRMEQFTQTR